MTRWITEQECSDLTSIPTATLRDWRFKKLNLPFTRVGRLVRYSEAEVDAYMQAQTVSVTTAP